MMQSILQSTTKSLFIQTPQYHRNFQYQDQDPVRKGGEVRKNTSEVFRGSMFQRVIPIRKCASCGM